MPSVLARPVLHSVHLAAFVVLVSTGVLLYAPSLRATLIGGYSLVIRQLHCWGGVAFTGLPLLVLGYFGVRSVFHAPASGGAYVAWKGLHLAITVALSLGLAVSGFLLWFKRSISEAVVDGSLVSHDWLTVAALVFICIHLVDVAVMSFLERVRSADAGLAARSEN